MRLHPFCSSLLAVSLTLTVGRVRGASAFEAWVHRSNNVVSNAEDAGLKLVLDWRGDLIVLGKSNDESSGNDFFTLKYSGVDGTLLWQRRYDGPAHGNDVPGGLAVESNGDVVVTGSSADSRGYPDIYTAKYAGTDGALRWEKRYNGPANTWDEAHAVAVDGQGNVVVTGYSHNESYADIYTAKYAGADGALLWEKRYNSPNNGWDEAQALAVDTTGNVVVAGTSTQSNGYHDFYAAKYRAADGRLLWERRYGSPAGGHDIFYAVAVDPSGNVAVAGSSGEARQGFYTAKLAAADGATRWEKQYQGGVALAVAVDPNGDVVTTGVILNENPEAYTAKYAAADGALLWERHYNGPAEDRTHAVTVDAAGNVLVAGYTARSGAFSAYYTAKYAAADGALLWERRYNGPANGENQALAVAVNASGQVFVTGFSHSVGYDSDCYTAKYRPEDGATLWEKRYRGTGSGQDRPQSMAIDSRGDVVIAGISLHRYESAHYMAKYAAADGALLWETRHFDPTHPADQPLWATVDNKGDVTVAGFSWDAAPDHYTAKYAGADGALLWSRREPGLVFANDMTMDAGGNVVVVGLSMTQFGETNLYAAKYAAADGRLLWEKHDEFDYVQDQLVAVAVDRTGNVAVTGRALGTNYSFDYYTAKYAGTNGAVLWQKKHDGAGPWNNLSTAVAVDLDGNVVVTGRADADFYTVKYAAVNGSLLWEKRSNAPGNWSNHPRAVSVAANGDVVVTGSSYGAANTDFYTARYAAASGTLLWERRYNGPADRDDVATAVAVDAAGNVVVTGSSYNSSGTSDYLTLKYAAADGVPLWEKRYNGPADGDDFPGTFRCLALGPGGTVAVTGASDSRSGDLKEQDYVTVLYVDSPRIVALANGAGYQLQFPSVPGQRYALERAHNLTGPWTTLRILTAPPNGQLFYTDANPPAGEAFYRLSAP